MRVASLLILLFLAACGTARSSRRAKPETLAPPEAWAGVARVAVLPPDNWTTSIGPEYVAWNRAVIAELLREKGYAVTPLAEVNRFLLRNRFTQAGEVRLYSMADLGKELSADAILFWDITGEGLNVDLVKADGTRLWGSGEVYLDLPYNAPVRAGVDERMALSLHEILRKLPPRP
ncbi:MAG TPA: GNA1162 family protein [Planctomycetota bacterium]|nr:GNA1162 family protein [Planctomycetota bacterium]